MFSKAGYLLFLPLTKQRAETPGQQEFQIWNKEGILDSFWGKGQQAASLLGEKAFSLLLQMQPNPGNLLV